MLIKNATLTLEPPKNFPLVACIIGQDPFQTDRFAQSLTKSWRAKHSHTERINFDLNSKEGWTQLLDEAKHYSLFANHRILYGYLDKKTLDASAKNSLENYLKNEPADCFFILKAPHLTAKSLERYSVMDQFELIHAITPNTFVLKKWMEQTLTDAGLSFDKDLSALLLHYHDGNLLAMQQSLDKLILAYPPNTYLESKCIETELMDQSDFVLFDLPKFCFENNPTKAIQLLRSVQNQKQDTTLVLWTLTQAIRVLIRMHVLLTKKQPLSQLKLWPSQLSLYQNALKRYDLSLLKALLTLSDRLDKQLKTTSLDIYQALERMALSLCTGRLL